MLPEERFILEALPYVPKAFAYWHANRKANGFEYFFTWLHNTQGVIRIQGLSNLHRIGRGDSLEFQDERAMLMFVLRWG